MKTFSSKPPTNREIVDRYRNMADHLGRPYFLPMVDLYLEDDNGHNVAGHPTGCVGPPVRSIATRRKYPCRKVNFCAYCWERRCRESGLLAARVHMPQPVRVKFSVSLPTIRTHVDSVKEARKHVWEFARKHGFTHRTIWIHTFGENPAEGPKGHLDGIISGPEDADLGIFDDYGCGFWPVLKDAHTTRFGAIYQIHMANRIIDHTKHEDLARDLLLGGFYAGRPTFPTRRVLAGLYQTDQWRVRLTNVNRKTRRPDQISNLSVRGLPVIDWTQADLTMALNHAEEWRREASRVSASSKPTMSYGMLSALIRQSRWRRIYRLPPDRQIEEENAG